MRYRVREGLVRRDEGHGAEGNVSDGDFEGNLLTPPTAVDGDGWNWHGRLRHPASRAVRQRLR